VKDEIEARMLQPAGGESKAFGSVPTGILGKEVGRNSEDGTQEQQSKRGASVRRGTVIRGVYRHNLPGRSSSCRPVILHTHLHLRGRDRGAVGPMPHF